MDLADLAEERFILMSRKHYPDAYDLFEGACRAAGSRTTILDEGDTPNVLYLVGIGLGVTLAPAAIQNCVIPGVVFHRWRDRSPRSRWSSRGASRTCRPV